MVNSVSYPGPATADLGPKLGSTSGGQPQPTSDAAASPAPVVKQQQAEVAVKTAAPSVPVVSTQPLVQPLTSLALWRDGETGMQMAVVRDRVTGQVVEQFPTERARRLAAMVKQQEAMAQSLQSDSAGVPHIDLKT